MKILAIAAHPDDEILGCGATLAKHVLAGDEVDVLLMADGVGSRDSSSYEERLSRIEAARKANDAIGYNGLYWNEPVLVDNAFDDVPLLYVVKAIEHFGFEPDIIYTHHAGDLNVDHRVTHEAVKTAFRPVPGSSVKAIRCFEIHSSTEWNFGGKPFEPNYFVNVHGEPIERKIKALNAYDAEMRAWPHARSYMSAISRHAFRGSTVGYEAAEAFVTLWERA